MAYDKPAWFPKHVFNRLSMRFGISGAHTLAVKRRRTGETQRIPVIPVEHEGALHVVSTRGEVRLGRATCVPTRAARAARQGGGRVLPRDRAAGRRARARHQRVPGEGRQGGRGVLEEAARAGRPPGLPARARLTSAGEADRGASRRSSGLTAGPASTVPSTSKREPWQGQSQVRSASFQRVRQPRCVQRSETACSAPAVVAVDADLPEPGAHDAGLARRRSSADDSAGARRSPTKRSPVSSAELRQLGRGLHAHAVGVEVLGPRVVAAGDELRQEDRGDRAVRHPPLLEPAGRPQRRPRAGGSGRCTGRWSTGMPSCVDQRYGTSAMPKCSRANSTSGS